MQRLTELFEAERYGGTMATRRLSASTSSPVPMLPKAAKRPVVAPATMRNWVIDDLNPASAAHWNSGFHKSINRFGLN